ncbi:translesion DNA synthesis-associated protein ImuA [Ramlibacter sp.]|uniref:translesion DNA synthesis-associated protein ImuA n=1 Tax=Ramlibacter sp. TaxID=1917967 RepID=UPI002BAB9486|nr:translesion DNA synthesis-associated protein ImuA [Ramlibacter sp.]HWI83390.1 translesion DNA synthesis-associated protein ImuA [Ramlibacter sp.]
MSRASLSRLDPSTLPHVWRVGDLARETATVAAGHPALDEALPGGGWPVGCLVEVLQRRPQQHVWQLLRPALATVLARSSGPVVLVGPPLQPFGPSLQGQGLPAQRLLCVHADGAGARLWAAEQALRCAQVAAVLAWLPVARQEELRRLHLAAQQQQRLLFVLRTWKARHESSPAPVRLLLDGVDRMEVQVLKRRGPPLVHPLQLPAVSGRLAALLEARKARRPAAGPQPSPAGVPERSHVLDRTAAVQ